jgi:hypothetical protein
MPWTFAHPAAVLPLRRFSGPGRLSFAALIIGSMSPDFLYYVGLFDRANFTHTPLGVFVVCLPAGLLVLCLALSMRDPIAQILPQPHREALLATRSVLPYLTLRSLSLVAASIGIGATTHILWDAFTHEGRFFVKHIEFLRVPLFAALNREFRVFNILQHASTLLGVTLLTGVYYRHARRFGSFFTLVAADRRRYTVLVVVALVAIVCALPLALRDATDAGVETNVSKLIVRQVVYATAAFFVLLSCIALWPNPSGSGNSTQDQ